MAIARKPKATTKTKKDVDVNALIQKGGSVANDTSPSPTTTAITLRMPGDMLKRVNAAVKKRTLKTPRHTWILEAILEKLEREKA